MRDKPRGPSFLAAKGNVEATLGNQGRVLDRCLRGLTRLNLVAGDYSGTVATQKNPALPVTIRVKVTIRRRGREAQSTLISTDHLLRLLDPDESR
jgi:hypothetical protein